MYSMDRQVYLTDQSANVDTKVMTDNGLKLASHRISAGVECLLRYPVWGPGSSRPEHCQSAFVWVLCNCGCCRSLFVVAHLHLWRICNHPQAREHKEGAAMVAVVMASSSPHSLILSSQHTHSLVANSSPRQVWMIFSFPYFRLFIYLFLTHSGWLG